MKSRVLIDDINGQPDAQEVRFTWMGTAYAIDLAEENYTVLATVIEQFIPHARTRGRSNAARKSRPTNASIIRDWARENGMEVPNRGRLPKEVVDAYKAEAA